MTRNVCGDTAPKTMITKKGGTFDKVPMEMVYEVFKHLGFADLLSACRVCRSWALLFKEIGRSIMETMPPFAMSTEFVERECKYVQKDFKGISGGFIVFENCYSIWFRNPVTSVTLEFSKPDQFLTLSDRIILTKLMPHGDYIVFALYRKDRCIHARRAGAAYWAHYSYIHKPWDIYDLVVGDGRVLGLTSKRGLVTIALLSPHLSFRRFMIKGRSFDFHARLFSTDNGHVMLAEHVGYRFVRVLWANMDTRKWEIVTDLGNLSLFVDDYNTCRLCDPRGWGGRANSVYYLISKTSVCSVVSYTSGDDFQNYQFYMEQRTLAGKILGWYFPSLMSSMTHVRVD